MGSIIYILFTNCCNGKKGKKENCAKIQKKKSRSRNDKEAKIKFYIDEAFMTDSHLIGVHPNDNTVSLWLKVEDLIKIIENNGNNIYFFNL